MERVGLTGASGYIGSALAAALNRTGADTLRADIRDASCWTELVCRADVIFHLAGNTSAAEADRDPDASRQSTVTPVERLIDAARHAHRRPRIVFASTATVYGLTDCVPVEETAETRPLTTYDRHKLEAEQLLRDATHAGDLDAIVLRLSNVYGPGPVPSGARERGFLNRAIAAAMSGADLAVYGDGDYVRDFVYLDDVVRAFVLAGAARYVESRCFNVGSGVGVTMRDALTSVSAVASRISGHRVAVHALPWPDDAHPIERRSFVAGIARIAAELDWRPAVALLDGIARVAEQCVPAGERPR
jgi:nucleoside-diphosphate-sugar epimerase